MLLKPNFHGTCSRIGAPSCFGITSPYNPTPRMVSGCIASSIRSPSTYGHGSMRVLCPGICAGLNAVTNSTYFACDVGL